MTDMSLPGDLEIANANDVAAELVAWLAELEAAESEEPGERREGADDLTSGDAADRADADLDDPDDTAHESSPADAPVLEVTEPAPTQVALQLLFAAARTARAGAAPIRFGPNATDLLGRARP